MSAPTTILFVSHSGAGDGAETCLMRLVTSLDRERFEPVLVMPAGGRLKEEAVAAGIRVHERPLDWWIRSDPEFRMRRLDIASCVAGLLAVIDAERPALVHTNTSVVIAGAIAARRRGLPHVWHLHEMLSTHPDLRPVIDLPEAHWLIGALSNRVVTVSDAVRSQLAGIDARRTLTVHNGVPTRVADASAALRVRSELALDADDVLALAVGALVPAKGHADLIDAAARARAALPRLRVAIVGRGSRDDVARLERRIDEAGLGGIVRLLGHRGDVPELLAASQMLVHPSHAEAFPTVVLEAMIAGRAIVATDCGGPSEIIADGETGLLVPPRDPGALADAIVGLGVDRARRDAIGTAASEAARERYTLEGWVAKLATTFEEVVAEGIVATGVADARRIDALVEACQRRYNRARRTARIRSMLARATGGGRS